VTVSLDGGVLLAFLLAFVRAGAFLLVAPPFASRAVVPPVATVGVAASLALLVAPSLASGPLPTAIPALLGSLAGGILVGAALGMVVRVLFAAVESAGGLIDLFSGIDFPASVGVLGGEPETLFSQFYGQLAILLLFASNGELLVLRGFEASFRVLPSGGEAASAGLTGASVLVADLGTMFVAAAEIALPVIAVLFASQVAIAMLAKAAPRVNAWWIGFPVQILLALLAVALASRAVPGAIENLVERMLSSMGDLLRLGGG
jgi:flagellar biosynthetic protein FliR